MATIDPNQLAEARNTLEGAKSIAILIGSNPTVDSVASSLALYLALSSYGKQVTVACAIPMTVAFNRLVGVDKIGTLVNGTGGKNLVISFPYQEGSIEKVSYNIENDIFNLVIEPREGYPMITQDMIRYSFSGGSTDAIITVGVASTNDLGTLFTDNQQLFSEKSLINIDINPSNSRFGNRSNIVDQTASTISELTTTLFSSLGFTIDADIASNLLAGISNGSNNFTSAQTTAHTFEAAAICLKNGARKEAPLSQRPQPAPFAPVQQHGPKAAPAAPSPFPRPFKSAGQKPSPFTQPPKQKPSPQVTPPKPQMANNQHTQPTAKDANQGQGAPPDWLKPKIFKGSTLL